ncbi:hypothetical protein EDF56_11385 [Novosphingobium sp. PhB165]|nr:hypothetical protein EDF56_11385 [Novosphingobium sp. PhB165]
MTAGVRHTKTRPDTGDPRLIALVALKSTRLVTVALANNTARIVWAVMARGEVYQVRHPAALAGIDLNSGAGLLREL